MLALRVGRRGQKEFLAVERGVWYDLLIKSTEGDDMNIDEAVKVNEAISRGEDCPSCEAKWDRPPPPAPWTLEHFGHCEYREFLDTQVD